VVVVVVEVEVEVEVVEVEVLMNLGLAPEAVWSGFRRRRHKRPATRPRSILRQSRALRTGGCLTIAQMTVPYTACALPSYLSSLELSLTLMVMDDLFVFNITLGALYSNGL